MVDETQVGERLARIETRLDSMDDNWKKHTAQDKEHYEKISGQVTQILIDRAMRRGEEKSLRRVAGWVSFCVATMISAAAYFVKHLMGG